MERAPETLVLDASAATKWFLKEEDTEKALEVREAHIDRNLNLVAPDLIVYEVENALNYHPKITYEDLVQCLKNFLELDIHLVPPSTEFSSEIARTARKLKISVYDASYVALSNMIATKLVTADKRLYDKVAKLARVYLLSELGRTWNLA